MYVYCILCYEAVSEYIMKESPFPDEAAANKVEGESEQMKPSSPTEGSSLRLEQTNSEKLFQHTIFTYFVPLEIWYTRTIVDKASEFTSSSYCVSSSSQAHRTSSPDVSQTPVITTTPDDVFYILKLVMSRMLSAGSVLVVQRTLEELREVIEKDYIGIIRKKLDDVYRNAVVSGSHARADKMERENRMLFIVSVIYFAFNRHVLNAPQILLNDLDISTSHLERLVREFMESTMISQNFTDAQGEMVKTCLVEFQSSASKFKHPLRVSTSHRLYRVPDLRFKSGIEQLFNQLLRPKLRNFMPEVYNNVSYQLDEDSYATSEYQDIVRKRFVKTWEGLVDGYKDAFTDNNYRLFFGLALDVLLRPWEKFMLNLKYTEVY